MFCESLLRKIYPQLSFVVVAFLIMSLSASVSTPAFAAERTGDNSKQVSRLESPINIAILIQDDLVSSVETNPRYFGFHSISTKGIARNGGLHHCGHCRCVSHSPLMLRARRGACVYRSPAPPALHTTPMLK